MRCTRHVVFGSFVVFGRGITLLRVPLPIVAGRECVRNSEGTLSGCNLDACGCVCESL